MARTRAIVAALKSIPGGTLSPQSSGMGRISPVIAEMLYQNPQASTYGPFLPRPPRTFSDGAFGPMAPVQPYPIDLVPAGGEYPDQRLWQYRVGWNLPTPPGTEGLKLASFDQLRTLAQKYSVARACIELRQQEIRGLAWDITMTSDAAKAYKGDAALNKDFGKRKAEAMKFFRSPDPDFWNFDSFLNAMLEEIFVYDALSIVFRPKYGARIPGMQGRGLLGSDLDCLQLVSGPTIRPLVGMHGEHPRPPAPAFQQYLYGVPRSDIPTIARGTDIDDYGLTGSEVNAWDVNTMLYAPYWPTRESPYGFPPVERALLPIISGLQKQEFQLDFFSEGTVPACYISPGDPNITPTQIRELQDALNAIAGDPAYHQKVIVLPPGSKVEPQRPVDLSDSFDFLVMNQVCMAFDVQPQELGIIPDVGATQAGPSASGIRFAGIQSRDVKNRKSTRPLLKWICDIFNMVLQDICNQPDMQFQFEGLIDDEDKQAITQLGVEQVQNGIASIDEVRERLDMPPWNLQETSEPVVFTAQGPVPFSMAPQLIQAAMMGAQGGQGTNSGQSGGGKKTSSSGSKNKKPSARRGGQTKPNGTHPAPLSPHREHPTGAHAAAAGAVQSPTPRTGGSATRSPVAGSRKRGNGRQPTQGRLRAKAVTSELDALRRHLRKNRAAIYGWRPAHVDSMTLARIADDLAAGLLVDIAIEKAMTIELAKDAYEWLEPEQSEPEVTETPDHPVADVVKSSQWPGWEHDLGLVGRFKQEISQAFQDAEIKGREIRKQAASGELFVSNSVLQGMISDAARSTFTDTMIPLWKSAWELGYEAGRSLVTGDEFDVTRKAESEALQGFLDTEGVHWVEKVLSTGFGNSNARSEVIARTEVARAMNAGALQAYKDRGVQHKHLLVAPDDTCDICSTAKNLGAIPLDAIFPGGGQGGPFHPNCRCVPAPAGVDVEPPQGHIGKSEKPQEDESRLAWLLLRAKGPGGKYRFLLQQRDKGTWGMPGGKPHVGEDPWEAAVRETREEIGNLPELTVVRTFHHVEGKIQVYLYLCDVPYFRADLTGDTPEETRGVGWFRKKEIAELRLTPKFGEDWNSGITLKDHVMKVLKILDRNESGEVLVDPAQNAQGGGARWPYPKRSDGAEDPMIDDMGGLGHGGAYYGGDDAAFPNKRGKQPVPTRFPSPETSGMMPSGGHEEQPGGAISVGKAGRHGGGGLPHRTGYGMPHPGAGWAPPGTGSVPAETPHPYEPHAAKPVTMAPDANENLVGEPGDSPIHNILPVTSKGTGGPDDHSDPNPVPAHHIYLLMSANFPPKSIAWVNRARWVGPVEIPWERIDIDGIKTWAASHQPEKVKEFEEQIKAHKGDVKPSILIQDDDSTKAITVDGHHRALARHNLGMPILAYLGMIDPKDRKAAEETHSSQLHQGADPRNKVLSAVEKAVLNEYLDSGLTVTDWAQSAEKRQMVSKESVHYRETDGARTCGNCVMFHPSSKTCDLVKGAISPEDVCDEWEAKPADS